MKFFDHTREFIALMWTCAIIYFLSYCITHYGNEKEILTWILAYLAGVSSAVTGAYFSINTHKAPVIDQQPGTTTADVSITATTTPKSPDKPVEVEGFNNRFKNTLIAVVSIFWILFLLFT